MKIKALLVVCLFSLLINCASAQIRLPKIIASNMVLQRNRALPIWGWAAPGKTVKVKFAGQQKNATANGDGYWSVTLAPLIASADARSMMITSDTSAVTLSNILVGEVWLASGQSNMEYTMKNGYAKPLKGIDSLPIELTKHNPQIRLFNVDKVLGKPDVITRGWNEAGEVALEEFSAPAYYFAKNLQSTLHIPIGIICSAWGGTRIEPWTPESGYRALPAFSADVATTPIKIDGVAAGELYESMIKPLAPFALHGFIWYQGESNCVFNAPNMRYNDKMQALISSWRKVWKNDNLPFYSVLIAPHYYTRWGIGGIHTPETLPEFWEQQITSLAIPHTELVDVCDLVDTLIDIHPAYKWEVGRRLASVALAKDYGFKNLSYTGPRFSKMNIDQQKAVLTFNFANRLKTSDGKQPAHFTIAGADGKFVPAVAEIKGNKIIVYNADVPKPTAVRFCWNETARPNLVNDAGLPALPFRTDGLVWHYSK